MVVILSKFVCGGSVGFRVILLEPTRGRSICVLQLGHVFPQIYLQLLEVYISENLLGALPAFFKISMTSASPSFTLFLSHIRSSLRTSALANQIREHLSMRLMRCNYPL